MDRDLITAALLVVTLASAAVLIRTRYGNLGKRLRAFVDRTAGPALVPFLINAVYAVTALGWIAIFLLAGDERRAGWDELKGRLQNVMRPGEGR